MTKIIFLIILAQVVFGIYRQRAARKAAEAEAQAENGEVIPADNRQDRDQIGQRRRESENIRDSHDEHHRTQRARPDWEAGEHQPSPLRQPRRPDKRSQAPSKTPSKAKSLGRDLLEQLAKELGLPMAEEKESPPSRPNAPPQPARPHPALPGTAKKAAKGPERPREKSPDALRKPSPILEPLSHAVAPPAAIPLPMISKPEDVASAIVLQAILGEAPGLKSWKRYRGLPERSPR